MTSPPVPASIADLHDRVRRLARERPDLDERAIAEAVIPTVSADQQRDLAVAVVADWCWRTRRDDALALERAAQRARDDQREAEHQRALDEQAERNRPDVMFRAIYDDPGTLYGAAGTRVYSLNLAERKRFKRWCERVGSSFAYWHNRAARVVVTGSDALMIELFAEDWHPGGVSGRRSERVADLIADVVDEVACEMRLEFNAELLRTEFALGDGRRVTWGEATIADHEQRIALLTRNAVANTEAAARHRSAVTALKVGGADTLADMILA